MVLLNLMIRLFPKGILKMTYQLKQNEIFCCNNGCGECSTYQVWDEYRAEITPCGGFKKAESQLISVSACCNEGVFVWDTVKDDEVAMEELP
jgi:hypothetical protein